MLWASILEYESSVEYESIKEQWLEHSTPSILARFDSQTRRHK